MNVKSFTYLSKCHLSFGLNLNFKTYLIYYKLVEMAISIDKAALADLQKAMIGRAVIKVIICRISTHKIRIRI